MTNNQKDTNELIECSEDDIDGMYKNIEEQEWNKLSMFPLPPEIVEKYKDKLNWKIILHNWNITPEFYEKYKEYFSITKHKKNEK